MCPLEGSTLCLAGLPLSYVDTEIGPRVTVYTEYPPSQVVYTCDDTGTRWFAAN